MKRLLSFSCALVLLVAVPLLARATFTRPSDVLLLANSGGRPTDFNVVIYGRMESATEDVQVFGGVTGMAEGKTQEDAKVSLDVTLTMTMNGGRASGNVSVLAANEKVYFKISDLQVSLQGFSDQEIAEQLKAFHEQVEGKWFVIDALTEASGLPLAGDYWQQLAVASDLPLSGEQLKEIASQIIDAIFQMEVTGFTEGTTYHITLKPDFLRQGARALASALEEMDPASYGGIAPLIADDPETLAIEEELGKWLTVKMKVDTSAADEFRFMRSYISFALPEEGLSFSLEGETSQRSGPVYFVLPQDAQSLAEFMGAFGVETIPEISPILPVPTPSLPVTPPAPGGCRPGSLDAVRGARTGECPVLRPTRRTLLEQTDNRPPVGSQVFGIGAEILVTDGRPVVSAILPGSPAEGAQLLAGDIVVQIDGVDTLNESLSAIVQKLRGPKGSVVTLKILRDGQLMTVILERDLIVVPR